MKAKRSGHKIDVSRGEEWVQGNIEMEPRLWVDLCIESLTDPQASPTARLSPAEARRLAAGLVALADEIDQEQP